MSGPLRQILFRYAYSHLRAFPILGWGGAELWQALSEREDVVLSQSPHDTDLIVLAGEIPSQWQERLRALIETVALPRAVLWLRPPGRLPPPEGLAVCRSVTPGQIADLDLLELLPALAHTERANRSLTRSPATSPWRGIGPYGQGGQGLVGGVPFGRQLATPAEDADQLALDDVPLLLGPHLPCLPSGLQLALRMQGDRVRLCESVHNAFPLSPLGGEAGDKVGVANVPALEALGGRPVALAALERARLFSHICWMADFLTLAGLPGYARRLRSRRHDIDAPALLRWLRPVERALRPLLAGAAVLPSDPIRRAGVVGPVARASGLPIDARIGDPAYAAAGYEPVLEPEGDLWARWRVRVREALQCFSLIERAGARTSLAAEGPRGSLARQGSVFLPPTAANLRLLKERLAGMEWQTALLFIASLDLSMEEAALQ